MTVRHMMLRAGVTVCIRSHPRRLTQTAQRTFINISIGKDAEKKTRPCKTLSEVTKAIYGLSSCIHGYIHGYIAIVSWLYSITAI